MTTSWMSADGLQEVVTQKLPADTPETFRARHILDVSEALADEPPV